MADLTGQWSGFAQITIPGGYCEYTGNVNAYLQQDGNNIAGEFSWVATSSKSANPDVYECDYRGQTYSDNVQGTLSGSQITLQSSEASFTGWYASSGIKLDIVFGDESIGITQLSPTGFSPPPFESEEAQDTDGDGISDDVDECIGLLEDYYGENDEDGCPEKDSDGDNIYDYIDACPYDKEDFGEDFTDGCPEEEEEDSDSDGWLDSEDSCPYDPEDYFEFGEVDGCPETDTDGDRIYDSIDQCKNEPEDLVGEDFEDGCPEIDSENELPPEEWIENELPPEEWIEGVPKVENIQVNKGSATITSADGTVVSSNEFKIGDTIQTGTNADTNVKIGLEDGDGVINLQENTKLSTTGITLSEEEYAAMEADVELFEKNVIEEINKAIEKKYSVTLSEEEYAAMEADVELFEKDMMEKINKNLEKLNMPLSEDEMTEIQTKVFLDAREDATKTSIVEQVNEELSYLLDSTGLSEEDAYVMSTGFATGMLLGLIPATGIPGAMIATGYILLSGAGYFEFFAPDISNEENQNRVIFTPDALLIPHGTEFTVTIENGKTKLDVMEGEVSVIPLDTNNPITTVEAGNSISVSDNKVEETSLNTASIDKWWEVSAEQPKSSGGCLIATATYGSELAPQVQFLREIRDNTVLSTVSGTSFMTAFNAFYYSFSPTVADLERQNPIFKETVKIVITPLLTSLSLLQHVDIDSEAEMLGYGIGIILLNIGMYFVAPALIIFKLKNRK
ncbi:MAG: CFI-box-CTERM domain-containing protein [Nitrosopumilaceae archaeon]|nr:CFI-box-CTERM domain-containing protein [Nitrosopumilaceae archaeon]